MFKIPRGNNLPLVLRTLCKVITFYARTLGHTLSWRSLNTINMKNTKEKHRGTFGKFGCNLTRWHARYACDRTGARACQVLPPFWHFLFTPPPFNKDVLRCLISTRASRSLHENPPHSRTTEEVLQIHSTKCREQDPRDESLGGNAKAGVRMSALCFLGVPGGGFQVESVARKPRRHSADDRRTGPLGLSSNYTRPRPVRPSPFIQTPPRAPSPWAAESKGRLPTCHGYWPPRGAHANWRLITEQRHAWGKP